MAGAMRWSPKAAGQFEQICSYIASDSPHYARLFARKVNALIKTIPQFPKSGRVVPEFNNENLRERIFQNYRIVYRVKPGVIEIVAITHGAALLQLP